MKIVTALQGMDYDRILALVSLLGSGILFWAGAQFSDLPRKVVQLETKQEIFEKRFDRVESKIDRILERVR